MIKIITAMFGIAIFAAVLFGSAVLSPQVYAGQVVLPDKLTGCECNDNSIQDVNNLVCVDTATFQNVIATCELLCQDFDGFAFGIVTSFNDPACIEAEPPGSIHVLKLNFLTGEVIPGWEIWLQCIDGTERHEFTDADGMVWFFDIPAPNFCEVREEERPGWTPLGPSVVPVDVNPGEESVITFENEPEPGSIHVTKFNAITNDVIEGWAIRLDCADGTQRDGLTDGDGMVWFFDIPAPNDCIVSEEERPGWTPLGPPVVPVDVNPGEESEVTFVNEPPPPGSIHVTKLNALTLEPIEGWEIWLECIDLNGNNDPNSNNHVDGNNLSVHAETDGDGLLDNVDQCINEPENLNNWEDSDGCPDIIPDTDGDRILDNVDQCINEAENINN